MIAWLRRLICRCPEPEPMLQVTSSNAAAYDMADLSISRIDQYLAEGSIAPPWPADLPEGVKPRHLHLVHDTDTE